MATTVFHKGKRPRIESYNSYYHSWEQGLPDLELVSINTRTANFRTPHVIGGLAQDRKDIRPAIGTIVRVTEGAWAGFLAKVTDLDGYTITVEPFGANEATQVSTLGVDYLEQEQK